MAYSKSYGSLGFERLQVVKYEDVKRDVVLPRRILVWRISLNRCQPHNIRLIHSFEWSTCVRIMRARASQHPPVRTTGLSPRHPPLPPLRRLFHPAWGCGGINPYTFATRPGAVHR